METLLALLSEVAGELLGKPQRKRDPDLVIDKKTGKMRTISRSKPRSKSMKRKPRHKRRRR
jgi:hypothetical protein